MGDKEEAGTEEKEHAQIKLHALDLVSLDR